MIRKYDFHNQSVKVQKLFKFVGVFKQNMDKKKYLVAMAAGHGTRMGSAVPKQFIEFEGKPILQRSIEKFIEACPDIKVVTVLPKEYMEGWRNYCQKYNFYYPQVLVEGGITRFHSVQNALKRIPDGAIVAIHDGVRPLISTKLIATMFDRMSDCRALIPVLPSVDTLKMLRQGTGPSGESVLETIPDAELDRSLVYRAQTPQMFRSEDIKSAYGQAFDLSFTDDASVAARKKIPLSYIQGEKYNIKITTKDDLDFAKAIFSLTR